MQLNRFNALLVSWAVIDPGGSACTLPVCTTGVELALFGASAIATRVSSTGGGGGGGGEGGVQTLNLPPPKVIHEKDLVIHEKYLVTSSHSCYNH